MTSPKARAALASVALFLGALLVAVPSGAADGAAWPNASGLDGSMRQQAAAGPGVDATVAWHNDPALPGDRYVESQFSPLVVGEHVVLVATVATEGRRLVGIDRRSGAFAWEFDDDSLQLVGRVSPVATQQGTLWAMMRRAEGYGHAGSDYPRAESGLRVASLVEVDATTGDVLRIVDPSTQLLPQQSGSGGPLAVLEDGDLLVRGARPMDGYHRSTMTRVDGATLAVQWEAVLGDVSPKTTSTAFVAADGVAHVVEYSSDTNASFLFSVDLGDGTSSYASVEPPVTAAADRDIVALADGGVAFDAGYGVRVYDGGGSSPSLRWDWTKDSDFGGTTRVARVGDVLVLGEPFESRLLGLDLATGAQRWTWKSPEGQSSIGYGWLLPSDVDGVLYVRSAPPAYQSPTSTIVAIDAGGGTKLGETSIDFPIMELGPIDEQGRMIVNYRNNADTHLGAVVPGSGGATPEPSEPPADDEPTAEEGDTTQRCLGTTASFDRAGTDDAISAAVSISQCRFQGIRSATSAVVARHDVFADALAGAGLLRDAPLLFTRTDALDSRTAAEVDRVLPSGGTVYVLGGTGAVSEAVADDLRQAGHEVVRLRGEDRIATALAIAEQVITNRGLPDRVAIARAFGVPGNPTSAWADSVSVGSTATWRRHPVLVTPTGALDERVAAWLRQYSPNDVFLLGGTGALSEAVEAGAKQVVDATSVVTRVSGPDRAATAVAIAARLWSVNAEPQRVLVNGYDARGWAAGLAAAGLAADIGAPIVLAPADGLPPPTARELSCRTVEGVTLVGGQSLLPDARGEEAVSAMRAAC